MADAESSRGDDRDDTWGETWGETPTVGTGTSLDSLSREDPEESAARRCRRYVGVALSATLCLWAVVTPVSMVALPQLLWGDGLDPCGTPCQGLYVSLGFKLLTLLVCGWALFLRPPRAALPRCSAPRCLLGALLFLVLASYWLLYGVRVVQTRDTDHRGIVGYAGSLLDLLLLLQYLALVLLEVRHLRPAFSLRVVRSPDGACRFYNVGHMSIQRAAVWILDQYYSDFPVYNPTLLMRPKSVLTRNRSTVKVHNLREENASTFAANASRRHSSYCERCYEANASRRHSSYCERCYEANASRRHSSYCERCYEEAESERKVRRRKASLVGAVEDSFSLVQQQQLEPGAAARVVLARVVGVLQRYLRATGGQQLHSMESVLRHLTFCITHNMAPKAFLQRYLSPGPTLQYQSSSTRRRRWTLVSEERATASLSQDQIFSLKSRDFSLVVAVTQLLFLSLEEEEEEEVDPKRHKVILRLQETDV